MPEAIPAPPLTRRKISKTAGWVLPPSAATRLALLDESSAKASALCENAPSDNSFFAVFASHCVWHHVQERSWLQLHDLA
jgi:hypothetical protein